MWGGVPRRCFGAQCSRGRGGWRGGRRAPTPGPLPSQTARGEGEKSIAWWLRATRPASAPSGLALLAHLPQNCWGGWCCRWFEVRRTASYCARRGPSPGPSPLVPRGEGRIRSRFRGGAFASASCRRAHQKNHSHAEGAESFLCFLCFLCVPPFFSRSWYQDSSARVTSPRSWGRGRERGRPSGAVRSSSIAVILAQCPRSPLRKAACLEPEGLPRRRVSYKIQRSANLPLRPPAPQAIRRAGAPHCAGAGPHARLFPGTSSRSAVRSRSSIRARIQAERNSRPA